MNRQLKLPMQFRYNHLEQPRVLKDVRTKYISTIEQDQVYFVGFRIAAKSGDVYHHAMIIADNFDAFLEGLAGEYNAIMALYLVTFRSDITLIFVRNLMMTSPEVIATAEQHNITSEIQDCLSKRDDSKFTLFGTIGDDMISVAQIEGRDGLFAIGQVRSQIMQDHGKEFMVLDLCQAHPIRHEFNALFDEEVVRFKSLVDDNSTGSCYVH